MLLPFYRYSGAEQTYVSGQSRLDKEMVLLLSLKSQIQVLPQRNQELPLHVRGVGSTESLRKM